MDTLVSTANNLKITDSLHSINNYVTQSDLTNIYRDFLSNQSSNYSNLITALLGITAILIGFSLFWNFIVASNRINAEVKKAVGKNQIELKNYIDEKFKEVKSDFDSNIRDVRGMVFMNLGLHTMTDSDKSYGASIGFWLKSIYLNKANKNDALIRIGVNSVLEILETKDCYDFLQDFNYDEKIQNVEEFIPEILDTEKQQILKILKSFKAKSIANPKTTINIDK